MEPVPETKPMDEFKSAPAPSIRFPAFDAGLSSEFDHGRKIPPARRSTDPSPATPLPSFWNTTTILPYRPRTASPLSGSHTRSRSSASAAPPMSRTQSLPGVNGSGHILYLPMRPSSPAGSPGRIGHRTPRRLVEESFPLSGPVRASVLEPERRHIERSISPTAGQSMSSLGRPRRPASPLRNMNSSSVASLTSLSSGTSSAATTPPYRAHDPFHSAYGSSLSSVPSTPTSTRSRSPSISSLETIPDSPDAEEAALEAERIAHMKAAADAAENGDLSEAKSRGALDLPTRGRTMAFGPRDKRKRWSVCGAERRGDLDLETIWED